MTFSGRHQRAGWPTQRRDFSHGHRDLPWQVQNSLKSVSETSTVGRSAAFRLSRLPLSRRCPRLRQQRGREGGGRACRAASSCVLCFSSDAHRLPWPGLHNLLFRRASRPCQLGAATRSALASGYLLVYAKMLPAPESATRTYCRRLAPGCSRPACSGQTGTGPVSCQQAVALVAQGERGKVLFRGVVE